MTIEVTRLPNGFTVATDRMDHVESVMLGVWTDVGTRHERPEENGVAHLLEHMKFKGTKTRDAGAISLEIERAGGRINAYTGHEITAYYARILAEYTPLGVNIIADMMQNSRHAAKDLKTERPVVIQEIGQYDDQTDEVAGDLAQALCYPGQGLGRSVLGSAEIVSGLTGKNLHDYTARNYRAGGMTLAAAGKLDHQEIVRLAEKEFAGLRQGRRAAQEPARYAGGVGREFRESQQTSMQLCFEAAKAQDKDFYAFSVLAGILGGGMSSRLFQEVREKRGLVYSIYASSHGFTDTGLLTIGANSGPQTIAKVAPLVAQELNAVANGVTPEEVERVKAQFRASLLMGQESTGGRGDRLAQQVTKFGAPVPLARMLEQVDAIGVDAVLQAAQKIRSKPATLALAGSAATGKASDEFIASLTQAGIHLGPEIARPPKARQARPAAPHKP